MSEAPTAVPVRRVTEKNIEALIEREWLVTNGLGGYASGTVAGVATRRYHGLLVAAHAAPLGRVMMLNHLLESFRFPDYSRVAFGGSELAGGALEVHGAEILSEFRYEMGLPVWRYETKGHVFEKRIVMPHRRNTVHIEYRLISGPGPVRLKLRPSVHFRGHDDPVSVRDADAYVLNATMARYELSAPGPYPPLRLWVEGENTAFILDGVTSPEVLYRVEEHRGYEGVGVRWSPGEFRTWLGPDKPVTLSASTETWERALALGADEALAAEHERRRRPHSRRRSRAARGFRRGTGPRRGPVHHHAGHAGRGHGPCRRRGRRGPHRHRGLSLVHGLGPRHDDQPRRPGPVHRPPRRGAQHPAHLRDSREGRPHPQLLPGQTERRRLPHRGRHALVFPGDPSLRRNDRRPPLSFANCCRSSPTSSRSTSRARASASASMQATACCDRVRGVTNSPGWTRSAATGWSRRGAARRWRSTRCGTTPSNSPRAGCARKANRENTSRRWPSGLSRPSTAASGARPSTDCSMSSTLPRGKTTPLAGRTSCSPSR